MGEGNALPASFLILMPTNLGLSQALGDIHKKHRVALGASRQ
jgi:hypothetical protein